MKMPAVLITAKTVRGTENTRGRQMKHKSAPVPKIRAAPKAIKVATPSSGAASEPTPRGVLTISKMIMIAPSPVEKSTGNQTKTIQCARRNAAQRRRARANTNAIRTTKISSVVSPSTRGRNRTAIGTIQHAMAAIQLATQLLERSESSDLSGCTPTFFVKTAAKTVHRSHRTTEYH